MNKTIDQILADYQMFNFDEAFTDNELHHIKYMIKAYHAQFQSGEQLYRFVKASDLNMEVEELLFLIYHQTGMTWEQFRVSGMGLTATNLVDKRIELKYRYDKPLNNLRLLRDNSISVLIVNLKSDEHLKKTSPPLYNWLEPLPSPQLAGHKEEGEDEYEQMAKEEVADNTLYSKIAKYVAGQSKEMKIGEKYPFTDVCDLAFNFIKSLSPSPGEQEAGMTKAESLIEGAKGIALKSAWKEIERLKKEIEGWYAYKRNIDEALNSGDGVYRP